MGATRSGASFQDNRPGRSMKAPTFRNPAQDRLKSNLDGGTNGIAPLWYRAAKTVTTFTPRVSFLNHLDSELRFESGVYGGYIDECFQTVASSASLIFASMSKWSEFAQFGIFRTCWSDLTSYANRMSRSSGAPDACPQVCAPVALSVAPAMGAPFSLY
jgi:hypothetical protein